MLILDRPPCERAQRCMCEGRKVRLFVGLCLFAPPLGVFILCLCEWISSSVLRSSSSFSASPEFPNELQLGGNFTLLNSFVQLLTRILGTVAFPDLETELSLFFFSQISNYYHLNNMVKVRDTEYKKGLFQKTALPSQLDQEGNSLSSGVLVSAPTGCITGIFSCDGCSYFTSMKHFAILVVRGRTRLHLLQSERTENVECRKLTCTSFHILGDGINGAIANSATLATVVPKNNEWFCRLL